MSRGRADCYSTPRVAPIRPRTASRRRTQQLFEGVAAAAMQRALLLAAAAEASAGASRRGGSLGGADVATETANLTSSHQQLRKMAAVASAAAEGARAGGGLASGAEPQVGRMENALAALRAALQPQATLLLTRELWDEASSSRPADQVAPQARIALRRLQALVAVALPLVEWLLLSAAAAPPQPPGPTTLHGTATPAVHYMEREMTPVARATTVPKERRRAQSAAISLALDESVLVLRGLLLASAERHRFSLSAATAGVRRAEASPPLTAPKPRVLFHPCRRLLFCRIA